MGPSAIAARSDGDATVAAVHPPKLFVPQTPWKRSMLVNSTSDRLSTGGDGDNVAEDDGYRSTESSTCTSLDQSSDFSEEDDDYEKPDSAYNPPCTLRVDYWKRSPDVQRRKEDHIAHIDSGGVSREDQIYTTTLCNRDIALEENMFPYDCPRGIRHYTLWSCRELTHKQICRFIEGFCRRHLTGQVLEWNYEENSHRSIDIPHVHVFLQFKQESRSGHVSSAKLGKHKRDTAAVLLNAPCTPPKACVQDTANTSTCPVRNLHLEEDCEKKEDERRLGKRPRHQ